MKRINWNAENSAFYVDIVRADGVLIVGLFVHGGKRGKPDITSLAKEFVKEVLIKAGIKRFKDYHVWHPTYKELTEVIGDYGFGIEKTYWQKGCNDTVCYIYAKKRPQLTRRS